MSILPEKSTNSTTNSNNFAKGLTAQDFVEEYLQSLGFSLVARNFQFYLGKKRGEIDLIMQKGKRLHLIEVKMRKSKNSKFGQIQDQITKTKLLTLAKAWQFFIFKNPYFKTHFCQFDAAFVWEKPTENSKTKLENGGEINGEIPENIFSENLEIKKLQNNNLENLTQNQPINSQTSMQKKFETSLGNNLGNETEKKIISSQNLELEIIFNAYQFDF